MLLTPKNRREAIIRKRIRLPILQHRTLVRLFRKIEYIEAIVREWVNGQLHCQLLESKLSIVRECWLGWADAAHALHIRTRERARRWRAENRRTGAVNTYMTTTSARYCNHTPPRTTPGPEEATMGRDCLVEAGKGSRNASERPGEGFLPPGGIGLSRTAAGQNRIQLRSMVQYIVNC